MAVDFLPPMFTANGAVAQRPHRRIGVQTSITLRIVAVVVFFVLAYDLPMSWFSTSTVVYDAPATAQGYVGAVLFVATFVALVSTIDRLGLYLGLLKQEPLVPAFVALAVGSVLWSNDPGQTLRFSLTLVLIVVLAYWLLIQFRLREILFLICVTMAIGVVINYVFIFALPRYGVTPSGWSGFFVNKNALARSAVYASLHFILAAGVFRRSRPIWIVFAVLALAQVIGSRGGTAYATMPMLIGLLIVFRLFRARKTLYGAVAISYFASSALMVLLVTANLGFISGLLGKDVTLTGRTILWRISWDVGLDHRWLGTGWGAFWQGWFSPSHEILRAVTWSPPHAHNALLDYFLVLGVGGVALAVALCVRYIVRAARAVRYRPGTLGLWPLTYAAFAVLYSITEFGVISRDLNFLTLVLLATVVGGESKQALAAERERTVVTPSPPAAVRPALRS